MAHHLGFHTEVGARALFASGLTVREAAGRLKVGKTALYKALSGMKTAPQA